MVHRVSRRYVQTVAHAVGSAPPIVASASVRNAYKSPANPWAFETATLKNGVKVVALATESPAAEIGIVVNAGTRNETVGNTGVSSFLKHAAFKQTKNRSNFRMVRELEATGAKVVAGYDRERSYYKATVARSVIGGALERLTDALSPELEEFEVDDARAGVEADILASDRDASKALDAAVHRTAFGTAGLGLPLTGDLLSFETLSPKAVKAYHAAHYVASNIAVVAVGVELSAVLPVAAAMLEGYRQGTAPAAAAVSYRGGQTHLSTATHASYCSLYFRGAPLGGKTLAAQAVLGDLIASHARVGAASRPYTDDGLFGFHLVGHSGQQLGSALDALLKLIAGSVGKNAADDALAASKKRVKAEYLFALDSSSAKFHHIASTALGKASGTSLLDATKEVDAVTAADVAAAAKAIFSSAPTLVTAGDNSHTPSYAALLDALRKGK